MSENESKTTPKIVETRETLYAVVNLEGENKVMPFPPTSPMYNEIVASGIGFRTKEYCEQYMNDCKAAEEKARKDEQEFLLKNPDYGKEEGTEGKTIEEGPKKV